jgi:hypothetical protein
MAPAPGVEALEDRLVLSFNWSLPARFGYENDGVTVIDRDGDGRMDMHMPTTEAVNFINSGIQINLDAGDYPADASFAWIIRGENLGNERPPTGGQVYCQLGF